eukprot:363395_1
MHGGLLGGGEDTGGLADDVDVLGSPGDLGGVHLGEDGDLLAVNHEAALADLDSLAEATVDGVVGEEVLHVGKIHKGVVDSNGLDALLLEGGAEYKASDASESVNSDLDHDECLERVESETKVVE